MADWLRRGSGVLIRALLMASLLLGVGGAVAGVAAEEAAKTAAAPAQVQELLKLLDDPGVRAWLKERPASAPADAAAPSTSTSAMLAGGLGAVRDRLDEIIAAAPTLTDELARAWIILRLEFEERGLLQILALIAGFVLLGFGTEWLFHHITRGFVAWFIAIPLDTVRDRLRASGIRILYALGMVLTFALGSVGAFLVLDWPPLLSEIVVGYLLAFLAIRLALIIGRFLLAPGGPRFRIIPMETDTAWFWCVRLAVAVGWIAVAHITTGILATLGVPPATRALTAAGFWLVAILIAVETAWHHPRTDAAQPGRRVVGRGALAAIVAGILLVLWFLQLVGARPVAWLILVVLLLPALIALANRGINHVLRPPGTEVEAATPGVTTVAVERGVRALLIIGAALFLAEVWNISLTDLTARDTLAIQLLRGALSAIVIALVADFAWHVLRAAIDRKLEAAREDDHTGDDQGRRARLRTLLPILRNVLMVVLVVMAGLMILSALGVEIGPLIAGAGVVGIAIGFGAQTLVKDIISGMFYLLDDAFRAGEYIQSGEYKGTVESFSLRSVKLRHHRGPLYTIPFGELGAVQNMSRDWVIDKFSVGVTYDTDLDRAKKVIKEIGKELARDPEFAPHIIEPLKMQGVEQFGDFAIQIRLKIKTRPGEQFAVRRRAYALIKKAFDANVIKFAFPTVQVAGGEDTEGAAARQSLEMAKNAEAQAAAR